MNQGIAGFLVFKKPNQYTRPSSTNPPVYIIPIACGFGAVSRDESFAVGTRCGTLTFHQGRVDEYLAFKRGEKSLRDFLFQNDFLLTLDEYRRNWKELHNKQLRRWFGDDLLDVY